MREQSVVLELRSVLGTGGGPEKTILLGSQMLAGTAYPTVVCYLRDARDSLFRIGDHFTHRPEDYVEVVERHSLDWRILPVLERVIRERSIRIVHAHDYKTDMLALVLARRTGVIPVSTVHGWSGHSWKERRLYYPLDRWLLKRYPRVISVSSDMRGQLIRSGVDPNRVTVLLNGIDPKAFHRDPNLEETARAPFGLAADAFVIGAIGRLEREKNFALLVNAFAAVAALHPTACLLIAGEGSERTAINAEVVRLGLSERCRLVGQVANIRLFHHALNVLVQSSDNEGTPNAILEAMAMATPIVATDVGGTAELARSEQEALLVRPRDKQSLVAAILDVAHDRHGAAVRVNAARSRVETVLSFEARMRRLECIYDELVEAIPA